MEDNFLWLTDTSNFYKLFLGQPNKTADLTLKFYKNVKRPIYAEENADFELADGETSFSKYGKFNHVRADSWNSMYPKNIEKLAIIEGGIW